MVTASPLTTPPPIDISKAASTLRHWNEPLDSPLAEDFAAAFERFGEARVVLLGEASHGTSEFYSARAAITRALIERHGFNIVAVEADWPDADRIDRFVRHRPKFISEDAAFARFPTWMWRNVEVRAFVDWLHVHNAEEPMHDRVEF